MTTEPTVTNAALDRLPLFATDMEIATAIVGRARADYWRKAILPALEKSGFPGLDPLHKARPVPLVKQYYALYFGITLGFTLAKPDGEERIWIPKRERKRMVEEEARIAEAGTQQRDRRAEAKANSDAWKEKKQKALEEFRAKKARKNCGGEAPP
ncbi:hypothetical protein [Mesorhizobium sp. M0118]|uniref:hypothetical protein n=1 Tax=Mesorhizobium sp. M0118 TaxID=2956884 RepID=UPI00333CF91A